MCIRHFVRYHIVLTVLLTAFFGYTYAQVPADINKRQAVSKYKAKVADAMYNSDGANVLAMCDTLYNLAVALDDTEAMLSSYFMRVTYLAHQMDEDDARTELDKLIILSDKTNRYESLYDAWSNLVVDYYLQKPDQIGAVAEVKRMQDHALKHNSNYGLGLVYCALGNCYAYAHNKAIDNYLKGATYLERAGAKTMTAYPYTLICQSYGELGEWDKVLEYAKKIKTIEGYPSSSAFFADIMMLRAYTHLDRKDEADQVFASLQRPIQDNVFSANSMSILGLVATEYLSKYGLFDSVPDYVTMISEPSDSLNAVLIYKEAQSDYKGAFEAGKQLLDLQNEEMVQLQGAQIENVNAHFDQEMHSREKSEIESHYHRWLMGIFLCLAVLLVVWVVYLNRMTRRLKDAKRQLEEKNQEISQHEQQLRTSEEMKSCFIESMSHEVRNPLHAIKGFSELLLDKTVSETDRKEFTVLLRRNVHSLSGILDKMIEMSEITTNPTAPKPESIDLARLCRIVADNARRNINKSRNVEIQIDNNCNLFAPNYYISSILNNLIENSLKFSDGVIKVEAHKVDASVLRIIVTDNGTGIPREKQEWVFERFTKIDSFQPGLGVGLYLSRILVTRLGGKIYIDPEYNDGCRVVVELPGFIY